MNILHTKAFRLPTWRLNQSTILLLTGIELVSETTEEELKACSGGPQPDLIPGIEPLYTMPAASFSVSKALFHFFFSPKGW